MNRMDQTTYQNVGHKGYCIEREVALTGFQARIVNTKWTRRQQNEISVIRNKGKQQPNIG